MTPHEIDNYVLTLIEGMEDLTWADLTPAMIVGDLGMMFATIPVSANHSWLLYRAVMHAQDRFRHHPDCAQLRTMCNFLIAYQRVRQKEEDTQATVDAVKSDEAMLQMFKRLSENSLLTNNKQLDVVAQLVALEKLDLVEHQAIRNFAGEDSRVWRLSIYGHIIGVRLRKEGILPAWLPPWVHTP